MIARKSSVIPKISIRTGSTTVSRRRAQNLRHLRALGVPVLEVVFPILDERCEIADSCAAGAQVGNLGIEEEEYVVRIGHIERCRDCPGRVPDRQAAAHVDVPIVIVVPPAEVRLLARGERLVEGLAFAFGELLPGFGNQAFALVDCRLHALFEFIGLVRGEHRLHRAQRAGGILDPTRRTDVDDAIMPMAELGEEIVELLEPVPGPS